MAGVAGVAGVAGERSPTGASCDGLRLVRRAMRTYTMHTQDNSTTSHAHRTTQYKLVATEIAMGIGDSYGDSYVG